MLLSARFNLIVFLSYLLFSAAQVFAADDLWIDADEKNPTVELNLPSFKPVIQKLGESVVNISIEGEIEIENPFSRRGDPRRGMDPFYDFFYPNPKDKPDFKAPFQSLGSGFVIHPEGYIVTNNHVVSGAKKIHVRFRDDNKSYDAKIVGQDPKTDIALLKLTEKKKVKPVVLGNSDSVEPGDWVIAIGNPFRLGHTATVGIVSAKSRRVGGTYDDFIQTDASINPGNSGGPLFNAQGEVIGVNAQIFSPGRFGSSGFNIGIGFAIPINLVKDIISQLHTEGKVTRGWLGVYIQEVTEDLAKALKLRDARGALVAKVMENSPSSRAGIKRRDVIVSFDGKPVVENDELPLIVAQTPVGKVVDVEVIRGGKRKSFKVKIAELKEEESLPDDEPEEEDTDAKLGLSVQDVTPELAQGLGIEETEGVIVAQVIPGSPAAKSGLRRGDIILEMGSRLISDTNSFKQAVRDIREGRPVLILVRRGGSTTFLTLTVEE